MNNVGGRRLLFFGEHVLQKHSTGRHDDGELPRWTAKQTFILVTCTIEGQELSSCAMGFDIHKRRNGSGGHWCWGSSATHATIASSEFLHKFCAGLRGHGISGSIYSKKLERLDDNIL
jgi:hypothetical protein